MDDFLGTSIQFSEQQIKLLEEEYAANQEKIVEDLINSGFLDSDYDESTETDCSEYSEFTASNNNNSNSNSNSNSSQIVNEVEVSLVEKEKEPSISPRSSDERDLRDAFITTSTLQISRSLTSTPSPNQSSFSLSSLCSEPSTCSSPGITSDDGANDTRHLSVVLASDISAVDVECVSNSEAINDDQYTDDAAPADIDTDDDDDEKDEYVLSDDSKLSCNLDMLRMMELVFCDVKSLMILALFMLAMPYISQHGTQHDEAHGVCGGVRYRYQNGYDSEEQYNEYRPRYQYQGQFLTETCIHWSMHPLSAQSTANLNDEEDEREHDYDVEQEEEEEENDQQQQQQRRPSRQHMLNVNIMQTTTDVVTNKVYRATLYQHEIKIVHEVPNRCGCGSTSQLGVSVDGMFRPRHSPLLYFGSGSPQIMRIFKETMPTTVRRQFARNSGIAALIVAFIGFTAFTANNGFNEIMTS